MYILGNMTYTKSGVDRILSNPCPQGIQGEDCAAFKLWLSNCLSGETNADCERLANEYVSPLKIL